MKSLAAERMAPQQSLSSPSRGVGGYGAAEPALNALYDATAKATAPDALELRNGLLLVSADLPPL